MNFFHKMLTLLISLVILYTNSDAQVKSVNIGEIEAKINDYKKELIKEVDTYIRSSAPNSRLDASKMVELCLERDVPIAFVLAHAKVESNFGTEGDAIHNNDVWNVRNNFLYNPKTDSSLGEHFDFSTPNESFDFYSAYLCVYFLPYKTDLGLCYQSFEGGYGYTATEYNYNSATFQEELGTVFTNMENREQIEKLQRELKGHFTVLTYLKNEEIEVDSSREHAINLYKAMLDFKELASLYSEQSPIEFMGIPIDGSKTEMIENLKTKGFKYIPNRDCLTGEFNGKKVEVYIQTIKNKVWRIAVDYMTSYNKANLRIAYNNLYDQFLMNDKYTLYDGNRIGENEYISSSKKYETSLLPSDNSKRGAVWFMIKDGNNILIFYENFNNAASGEDL